MLPHSGSISSTDITKKLFVYKSNNEAVNYLDSIIEKYENNSLDYNVSNETKEFLRPQIYENRIRELDETFTKWIK